MENLASTDDTGSPCADVTGHADKCLEVPGHWSRTCQGVIQRKVQRGAM